MAFGCQGKNYSFRSQKKLVNNTSVFESEFLTNDSLVPAFVFYRERQSVLKTRERNGGRC
jgi:hypothetical protein